VNDRLLAILYKLIRWKNGKFTPPQTTL